jgi:T5SS/PEP-CTERM-associated repeat protein
MIAMLLLRLGLLTPLVALSLASSASSQAIYNWNAPGVYNGNLGNPFIWSPIGPRGAGQEAQFNSAASDYTDTFTTHPTNFRTFVGNDLTFTLDGYTYTGVVTVAGNGSLLNTQHLKVGSDGNGTVEITGGRQVFTIRPAFTADFDADAEVDCDDLIPWPGDFGANALSDADDDGDSDGQDFLERQRQLDSGVHSATASGAVPERNAVWLAALALCAPVAASRGRSRVKYT